MNHRSEENRRTAYTPRSRQEWFNVPLVGEAVMRAIDAHAASQGGRKVLDIGCGGQPLRKALEEKGYIYKGLDVVPQPGLDLDFQAAVDEPFPPEVTRDGGYDLVLCTQVLEHVHGWPQAWQNLAQTLRPGGTLVVSCPFFYPLHEVPHDHWRPTPFCIRQAAETAGLSIVELRELGDPWDVLGTFAGAAQPVRGTGLLAPIFTLAARLARNVIWVMCRSAMLRRATKLSTQMYLENFAVLRRPNL